MNDSGPPIIQLGDLLVIGEWPTRMIRALAVIADTTHRAYDAFVASHPAGARAGGSKDACLFTSLAVREFLVAIGYQDATARSCACYMRANGLDGKDIWSIGIGKPNEVPIPDKFNGHAVVTIPSLKLLIDTTLYPAIRPQFGDALRGMIALPFHDPDPTSDVYGRKRFAGAEVQLTDRIFEIIWTDRPEIKWKQTIDFVRTPRRRAVTRALIEQFGEHHG